MRMRTIQQSGSRSSTGKVFDAGELANVSCREGYAAPPRGLFLSCSKTAGAILVELVTGEADGGGENTRRFHVDGKGIWLSVAGWRYAKLTILGIPADFTLRYTWLTEPPVSSVPYAGLLWTRSAVGDSGVAIPDGAVGVTTDRNEAGAVWRQTDATGNFDIPAALVAGTRTQVRGSSLVYAAPLGAALVLCWEIEVI